MLYHNSNRLKCHYDNFTGDFNGQIDRGIYNVAEITKTCINYPEGILSSSYCIFIQFPYYKTQIILGFSEIFIRRFSGDPEKWSNWFRYSGTSIDMN